MEGPALRSPSVATPTSFQNRDVAMYKPYPILFGWKRPWFCKLINITSSVVCAMMTMNVNK